MADDLIASLSSLHIEGAQSNGAPTSTAISTLRPYQRALFEKLTARMAAQKPLLAYLPTGGGKTRVGAAVLEAALAADPAAQCLFVVNANVLVRQTQRALGELGFDVGLIAACAGERAATGARVQIAMVQTLNARDMLEEGALDYDVVVIDEAHGAASKTYRQLLAALPERARVLGLSATPLRTKEDESLEEIFPNIEWGPYIAELIRDGHLVAPVPFAPDSKAGLSTGRGWTVNEVHAQREAVKLWKEQADGRRTIAFCKSTEASFELAALFGRAGVRAAHVDGKTPDWKRQQLLSALRAGDLQVLCNCDVLSEGFDEPLVSCVLLLRRMTAVRLYVQQVGRALRPARGKRDCIVLDIVGATARFGPLLGPPASDYRWEQAWEQQASSRKGKKLEKKAWRCPACGGGSWREKSALRNTCTGCALQKRRDEARAAEGRAAAAAAAATASAAAAARPAPVRPPLGDATNVPASPLKVSSAAAAAKPATPKPAAKASPPKRVVRRIIESSDESDDGSDDRSEVDSDSDDDDVPLNQLLQRGAPSATQALAGLSLQEPTDGL